MSDDPLAQVEAASQAARDAALAAAALKPSIGLQGLANLLIDGRGFTNDREPTERLVIHYGFLAGPKDLFDDEQANTLTDFIAFNSAQIEAFVEATRIWEQYAFVDFVRLENEDTPGFLMGNESQVELFIGGYGSGNPNVGGFVTQAGNGDVADFVADGWFPVLSPSFTQSASLAYGGYGFTTFLHELGHILGLRHPGSYNADDATPPSFANNADFREDNGALTLMSYFSELFGGSDFFGYQPATPMPADILAVNLRYIPPIDWTSWGGNTVYGWGGTFGPLIINNASDRIVGTIYDYDGDNWLDVSPYVEAATINLNEIYQSAGGLVNNIAILGFVTQVSTGSGNDTITGASASEFLDGNGGDDVIKGGVGDDRIYGDAGQDRLEGEGGYDTLNGGEDDDTLLGGTGNDELHGGAGDDELDGGAHKDLLLGEAGNDTLVADGQGDSVFGGAGDDLVLAGFGNLTDYLSGGGGNDTLSFANFAAAPGEQGIGLDLENAGYRVGLPGDFSALHRIDEAGDALPEPELDFESFTGSNGDDTLRGDATANRFNGGEGDDQLLGRDGADSLFGNAGQDTLNGGEGDDSLNGGGEADLLLGGDGTDTLSGSLGDDALAGGEGDDELLGGFQDDALDGGAGDDLVLGEQGDDTLHGGGGADTLMGGSGADHVFLSSDGEAWADTDVSAPLPTEHDLLDLRDLPLLLPELTKLSMDLSTGVVAMVEISRTIATHGFRHVLGSSLAEKFTLPTAGVFSVQAGGGDDRVVAALNLDLSADGGAGRDTLVLDAKDFTGDITLDLGAGTFHLSGVTVSYTGFEDAELWTSGASLLRGTEGANKLTLFSIVTEQPSVIEAGGGDDEIDIVLARAAQVDAGAGDDLIRLGHANGVIAGGTGVDTADFSASSVPAYYLDVDLASGTGGLSNDATNPGTLSVSGIENVTGRWDDNNRLTGDDGDNILIGGSDEDTLAGGGGNDTLRGQGGADSLDGGEGDDLVAFDGDHQPLGHGSGGVGFDLLVLRNLEQAGPFVLDALGGAQSLGGLTFSGFEAVDIEVAEDFASGVDLTGGAHADRLVGGQGNDTLAGLGGDDTLGGGEGDDLFLVGPGGGVDQIDGGAGTDTVRISLAGSGVGVLLDLGGGMGGPPGFPEPMPDGSPPPAPVTPPLMTSVEKVEMALGDGADSVIGSIGADRIETQGGGDVVFSGAGADTVLGGAGNDRINDQGNRDADRLYGEAGNDSITAGGGADLIEGGEGDDLLVNLAFFHPGFTNPDDERDTIRGGVGDDTIQTNTPGVLEGGAGNDLLILDLRRIYPAASGITLDLSNPAATVALPAGSSITGIERFELTLGGANDVMTLGYGQHKVDADIGFDVLRLVLAPGDAIPTYTILPPAFPWMSTVWTFDNGMTATGFEALLILPAGSLPGTSKTGTVLNDVMNGGAGADTLSGIIGNDKLNGGAGADLMIGGTGNDTYTVDNILDVVVEEPEQGMDTVLTTLGAYTLGANLERLVYLGGGAFTGTGNALANTLTGGAGADTLQGGEGEDTLKGGLGADRLEGGGGDDTYEVNDAGDAVIEEAAGGYDRVLASLSHVLAAAVERLSLTGAAGLNGTGNELANWLDGNAGANRLDGAGGDDRLFGGEGDDTLIGGQGKDALNGGAGADRMEGGTEDDAYQVNEQGDVVIEQALGGYDRVNAGITYTLPDEVERLTLSGDADLDGTGNALANLLHGNGGANRLEGGDGNDILSGFAGHDTLIGGAGEDTLRGGTEADILRYLAASEGGDRIEGYLGTEDAIEISASGFGGGLVEGQALVAGVNYFQNLTGLADPAGPGGQFIYETDAKRLWWDADGVGGATSSLVAALPGAVGWGLGELVIIA